MSKKKPAEKKAAAVPAPVADPAPGAPVVRSDESKAKVDIDLHGTGSYQRIDAPDGYAFDRVISVGGRSLEHVSEAADGVWQYRAM